MEKRNIWQRLVQNKAWTEPNDDEECEKMQKEKRKSRDCLDVRIADR